MCPEQPENPGDRRRSPPDDEPPAAPVPDPESGPVDDRAGAPDHVEAARPGDELLGRSLALVRHLRRHCPWDAAQTPESLRPYLLEEAHETADAVLSGNDDELAGELGDLLLNVAFQLVLAEEREAFHAEEVILRLEAKMRDRHPHVYGDAEAPVDWETLKARERASGTETPDDAAPEPDGDHTGPEAADASDPFGGLPRGLEPVSRAVRVQERAAADGFDWPDPAGALEKLREEADEVASVFKRLQPATSSGPAAAPGEGAPDSRERAALEDELGDLLFAAVNVTRLAGVHASVALSRAVRKFEARYRALLRLADEEGLDPGEASLEELEALWVRAKAEESDREG